MNQTEYNYRCSRCGHQQVYFRWMFAADAKPFQLGTCESCGHLIRIDFNDGPKELTKSECVELKESPEYPDLVKYMEHWFHQKGKFG